MAIGNLILMGLMVAVAVVLVIGIVLMARGGEANRKYGNKMMVLRVALQGLALALLGAMALMKG